MAPGDSPPLQPSAGRADLLSPQELSELGGLELNARHVVEGFVAGLHRSPHRGFSVEFAEHRAYQAGDDLRHVDWRMFGRSDRYYVKQFEAETNLRAYLLVDASASMGWSSSPGRLPEKLWYAKQLAACLALLLLRQGDAAGLIGFDERVREHLPPHVGRRQRAELMRRLHALAPAGETAAGSAIRDVAPRLRRRGLVVLLSDLLVDPDDTRLALQYLRHRGHEVLVLHLLDPGERELPAVHDARFVDPETGEEVPVSVADLRGEYRAAVEHALTEWENALRPHGADYAVIDTSQPFVHALRAFLHTRERLG
ncbi:MAG: DUF58 domain-containing protein [Longimicrobiales bacterium]